MTKDIQHVGVLGMHWGHRKPRPAQVRSAIGSGAKAAGKAVVNSGKAAGKAFQEKHRSRATVKPEEVKMAADLIKKHRNEKIKEFTKLATARTIETTGKLILVFGTSVAANLVAQKILDANS